MFAQKMIQKQVSDGLESELNDWFVHESCYEILLTYKLHH